MRHLKKKLMKMKNYELDVIHKFRGFSPLANYTDRAIAAGQRS
jgi:hypothetical protein